MAPELPFLAGAEIIPTLPGLPLFIAGELPPPPPPASAPAPVEGVAVIPLPGRDGAAGPVFIHQQAQAAAVWIVNHNLGLRPVHIAVQDPTGQGLEGYGVEHVSNFQTRLSFSPPAVGEARIT
ncbi:hypothetical protein [Deinococcus budaensis]|uniref:Uncharacterized protein n=1 Tax=Deinococcus budaensis TaxID=1665626 RepID=A0A7W8GFA2_9DEIO|nr:hypothetical protein [Deinococcus budaensis]MBB5234495.1 hypothetical protein [Deinococcus budaensis]